MARLQILSASLLAAQLVAAPAPAAVEAKDVQVVARSLGFVNGMPPATISVAVVFDPAQPGTSADAESFQSLVNGGAKAGSAKLQARTVPVGELGTVDAAVVIVPDGMAAHFDRIRTALKGRGIVSVSTDRACAEQGACVMAVRSLPKVEIVISRAAAGETGVTFSQAFKMLITEI